MGKLKLDHRDSCRICRSKKFVKLINWEGIPLSADVLEKTNITSPSTGIGEDIYPLEVYMCKECRHVQLLDIIDAGIYENYLYTPSFSGEFLEYVSLLADSLVRKYGECKVIEIGSSDGLLLKNLQDKSCRVLGFEPSECLAERASKRYKVPTKNAYFSNNKETSAFIQESMGNADLFIIRHVLEHLDDLGMIIKGIYNNLSASGTLMIEVPYLKNIVQENQFYAFFHEHLSYFSLHTLKRLLEKDGFMITDVQLGKLEGGSVLVYASKSKEINVEKIVYDLLEEEDKILSVDEIEKFSKRVKERMKTIHDFFEGMQKEHVRLAAWGAGQRAVTFLNACGVTTKEIQYIIDANENYQGKYLPGCHIPIVGSEELIKNPVEGVIIFATGYTESIVKNNIDLTPSRGGHVRFIRLIPDLEWIDEYDF